MADEPDIITLVKEVPFLEYVAKAYTIIDATFGAAREDKTQEAIAELQRQVATLTADLEVLRGHVELANVRIKQTGNRERIRLLQEINNIVAGLAFDLTRSPDVDELATIAHAAGLRISTMLEDTDLWLWSDVKRERMPGGEAISRLMDPEFKVIPLPVLAAAVAVFALASAEHVRREPAARGTYSERLATFHAAVTVRPDWIDDQAKPVTLQEKVRDSILVMPRAHTKCVTNGRCAYDLEYVNRIERTRRAVGTRVVQRDRNALPHTLCTAPANLVLAEKAHVEHHYGPVQTLQQLAEMVHRLDTKGSLVDEPVPFDDEVAVALCLYAVDPAGQLYRFTCDTTTRLRNAPGWRQSRVVGSGWADHSEIVAGSIDVRYTVRSDGAIMWTRHDGASEGTALWSGPNLVREPPAVTWLEDQYLAGSTGTLFTAGRTVLGGGGNLEPRNTILAAQSHGGYRTGGGRFSAPARISHSWERYEAVFGGGSTGNGDVIYGLTEDGRLYWHKAIHSTGSDKWGLEGPILIGWDWNIYSRVFATGGGFIFGVYPDGHMNAYHYRPWKNADKGGGGDPWVGPVRIKGPNWNGFTRIVAVMDSPDPGPGDPPRRYDDHEGRERPLTTVLPIRSRC